MLGATALESAKAAWAALDAGLSASEIEQRRKGLAVIVQAIAEEGKASLEGLGKRLGFEAQASRAMVPGLSATGLELDAAGCIEGAALTTRPTPHRARIGDRELYAWCALDTLFIPGLLGATLTFESTCAVTGEPIRVRVAPERVEFCEPEGAWLSVFLPDPAGLETGPASPT